MVVVVVVDGWVPKRFPDFAGNLQLILLSSIKPLRSSRGVPGASPTCVTDGGWWWMVVVVVVDGFQKGFLILLKIFLDEVYSI